MSRLLSFGVLFAAVMLQMSCALSPQQVTIKPDITVPVAPYGRGEGINISVEDRRSSTVIGTRGGVYGDTSTIEIGNDYRTEIAYALANAFTRWNFKPQVNGKEGDAIQFTLALTELSYVPDRTVAGKVAMKAVIAVEIKYGGRTYRGDYSANGELVYVTVPTSRRNNAEINKILNLALQKMFDDQGLIKFLQ
jgi:uncharacterized lipoprotein